MLSHRRIWVIGYLPSPGLPAGPLARRGVLQLLVGLTSAGVIDAD
jgi:hypothetical protein